MICDLSIKKKVPGCNYYYTSTREILTLYCEPLDTEMKKQVTNGNMSSKTR